VLTWLDEDGVPMERISKLAGHRDVNTTRTIYVKPSVETLKPAADVIDMRLRRRRVAKTDAVAATDNDNRKAQI
jgi:integrase